MAVAAAARRRQPLAFVAKFMGRRLEYTYEVRELVPGERFVMSTAEGPFPMETTYTFADADGATRMTLRNRGEPSGFAKVGAPVMARAMRRANAKDLARLKQLLEPGTTSGMTAETPLCPTCGQPASEALGGPEHDWECRNEACSEFGQPVRADEPPPREIDE